MIVDKQDVFHRKIRDILHGIGGFQVVAEVISCQMALETIASVQIDLVIVELALEDGDGVELTARLKQLPKPPQVIVFSTIMHEPFLMQVILAGADGYLMKDTPTRDIIRAFKNFERGGPAMQPSTTAHIMHLLVEQCKAPGEFFAKDKCVIKPILVTHVSSCETGSTPISDNEPIYTGSHSFPAHLSPQEEKVFALLRQGQRN
ncbi:MAG: response regulator, partial [Ktedonobacteraceae bacterium]